MQITLLYYISFKLGRQEMVILLYWVDKKTVEGGKGW